VKAKNPVTPEAEAALAANGISATDSVTESPLPADPQYAEINTPLDDIGPMIDAAIQAPEIVPAEEDKPLVDPEKPQREALKTGPPSGDEWLDFFSRIVLRIGTDLYVDFAFRGIDDSAVSDSDLARIKIRKEERDSIARPFAEFATKNKTLRKHGRQVVALTDSIESLMSLGIWMRRVNRIAKKYRPEKQKQVRPQVRIRETQSGDFGSPTGNPADQNGAGGYTTIINPGAN
jgi:hypothetical protein